MYVVLRYIACASSQPMAWEHALWAGPHERAENARANLAQRHDAVRASTAKRPFALIASSADGGRFRRLTAETLHRNLCCTASIDSITRCTRVSAVVLRRLANPAHGPNDSSGVKAAQRASVAIRSRREPRMVLMLP